MYWRQIHQEIAGYKLWQGRASDLACRCAVFRLDDARGVEIEARACGLNTCGYLKPDSTQHIDTHDTHRARSTILAQLTCVCVCSSLLSSRVIFTHDHKEASPTLRISYSEGVMELTGDHLVPLVRLFTNTPSKDTALQTRYTHVLDIVPH